MRGSRHASAPCAGSLFPRRRSASVPVRLDVEHRSPLVGGPDEVQARASRARSTLGGPLVGGIVRRARKRVSGSAGKKPHSRRVGPAPTPIVLGLPRRPAGPSSSEPTVLVRFWHFGMAYLLRAPLRWKRPVTAWATLGRSTGWSQPRPLTRLPIHPPPVFPLPRGLLDKPSMPSARPVPRCWPPARGPPKLFPKPMELRAERGRTRSTRPGDPETGPQAAPPSAVVTSPGWPPSNTTPAEVTRVPQPECSAAAVLTGAATRVAPR